MNTRSGDTLNIVWPAVSKHRSMGVVIGRGQKGRGQGLWVPCDTLASSNERHGIPLSGAVFYYVHYAHGPACVVAQQCSR